MKKRDPYPEAGADDRLDAEERIARRNAMAASGGSPDLAALLAPLRALLPAATADELSTSVADFALTHPVMASLADNLIPRASADASGAVAKAGAEPRARTGTGGRSDKGER